MKEDDKLARLLNSLGLEVNNIDIYKVAFTHKSFTNEVLMTYGLKVEDYDRLEFLGDSILYHVVTDYVFKQYPHSNSGELSINRKKMIEGSLLAKLAKSLGMEECILFSKGEKNNINNHIKVLEDVFESLIGAIYLDLGFDIARKFIYDNVINKCVSNENLYSIDYKSDLQILIEKNSKKPPLYVVTKIENCGEELYLAKCYAQDILIGEGKGKTKKIAEQQAAKEALKNLVSN